MLLVDALAEEKIAIAIRNGELDDLPGFGKPLRLEDDRLVAEELRVAYRLLRNAGYLPPELELRREIREAESLLLQVSTECELQAARRRLRLLQLKLAQCGREGNLLVEAGDYRSRLEQRILNDRADTDPVTQPR